MLKLTDVHAYYGKSHVLQGVGFAAAQGQVVGLLGRNGVGKTTTLRTIIGMLPCARGTITLDGATISGKGSDRIARAGIGYVPQGRRLFPHLSVLENLKLGFHGKNFGAEQLDLTFGYFPPLKERIGQLAGSLSGGEQQMLAIARVLINRPKLILLDEPDEGLMPLYVQQIAEIVKTMRAEGMSVVLVEQNLRFAFALCDRILFMEKGTIKFEGTPQEASAEDVLMRYLGVHIA
jgi:branched-chain amino acid transport system ATP-binding protein